MNLTVKSVLRSFLKNKAQMAIVALLLVFCGYFYSLMNHTLIPMSTMYDQAKTASTMEQFRFAPKPGTTDGQLAALADEHHFSYEKYRSKNVTSPDAFFIVTDYQGSIDKNIFTEGTSPQDDDTVAVSGTSYAISGVFYDLGTNRVADPSSPKARNAKIVTTENTYLRLTDGAETTTYLGAFKDEPPNGAEAAIQQLAESDQFSHVISTSSVPAASFLNPMIKTQTAVTYASIVLILVVSGIFIAMFINTHIKNSRARYGTAIAMGYGKASLILPYLYLSLLFTAFVFLGTIAGFVGKAPAIQRMANINFPLGFSTIQFGPLIVFTLVVAALLGAFTFLQVWKNLRKKPLELIAGQKTQKRSKIVAALQTTIARLPFKQHIKFAMALSHISRVLLMIPAVALSIVLISWGLSMNSAFGGSVKNLETKTSYQSVVSYADTATTAPGDYDDKFLRATGFLSTIDTGKNNGNVEINKPVTLEFTDLRQAPLGFDPDAQDGAIVPKRYQYLNNAAVGDTITIKTKDGNLKQRISGFNEIYSDTFYLPNTLLPDYDDTLAETSYNGEYLMPGAETPQEYRNIVTKQDAVEKAKEGQKNSSLPINMIILFCILSAFAIVSMLSKNNAADNAAAMMILLMSGYRKKTVSSLLLNIYNSTLLIGAALAAAVIPFALHGLAIAFSSSDGSFMALQFSWLEFGLSCAAVFCVYYLSLVFGTRKYLRMNLKEITN